MLSFSYIYMYIYRENCAVLWCTQLTEYIIAWWSYSFVCTLHYLIVIIMQTYVKYCTYKMLAGYLLLSVCLILSQFSQLSFLQYMGMRVISLPISLMIIVRICVLYLIIIIKSEVWPICHCLGLCHETMVYAVYISIFWWYICYI